MHFVRDLFSTVCNQHWELARILTGVLGMGMLGVQVYAVYKGQPFDPSGFGIGAGSFVGGAGVGISMKDRARNSVNVNINSTDGGVDNVG